MNRNSVHSKLNNNSIYVREQQNGEWLLSTGERFATEDDALNEGLNILRREDNIIAHRKLVDYKEWDTENGEFIENDLWD